MNVIKKASLWKIFVAAFALSLGGQVAADTNVSGTIAADTTWTLAQSPYLVTADVDVIPGVVLTIEPGVVVYFSADSELRVQGTLSALGIEAQRIVFTSTLDRAVNTANAGDWGRLIIKDQAPGATSELDYVDVRFGLGLSIESASPELNHLRLNNNAGPAIDLDLKSSPTGAGLSATGNQLNGIRVPAGAITGSVNWNLTGIPFVLESGKIEVGSVPLTISPSTLRLAPSATGSLLVEVGDSAPVGGLQIDLLSSAPAFATVPASVTIPAGQNSVTATVTATALPGTTTVTASRPGLTSATATVTVANPLSLSAVPASPVVAVGRSTTVRLVASEAISAGLEITLDHGNSSFLSAPGTVQIPAGGSFVEFDVQGLAVGSDVLTASAAGVANLQVNVTVRATALTWPAPVTLNLAETRNIVLTLSDPAPAGGLEVALTNSASQFASVPGSVSVAPGATSVDVPIIGVSAGATTITASAPGYGSAALNVTVDSIAILLGSSAQAATTIPHGLFDEFTVTLSRPAPAGGVSIDLTSDSGTIASVSPTTISIAEGQIAAAAPVRVVAGSAGQTQIHAEASGLTAAVANVTVESTRALLEWAESDVVVGDSLRRTVTLSRKRGGSNFEWRFPAVVTLAPSDAALSAPSTVTIPANQSTVDVDLVGVSPGAVTLSATADGYDGPSPQLAATVLTPALRFEQLDLLRGVGSVRDDFYGRWVVGVAEEEQPAASAQSLTLEVVDAVPSSIVSGFYSEPIGGTAVTQLTIPAGSITTDPQWTYVDAPIATGSYSIRATLPGVGEWTSVPTQVTVPRLEWEVETKVVGRSLRAYVTLNRMNGEDYAPPESDLEITLQSSDDNKVTVSQTIILPAGNSSISVPLIGVNLTTADVTISASAAGHGIAATLSVSVVAPTLWIAVGSNTTTESGRNPFYLEWQADGVPQQAVNASTIQVEIVNASPANIVGGIYSQATGGSLITELVIPAGSANSVSNGYVETPSALGSYAIQASLNGDTWPPQTVVVTEPTFRWDVLTNKQVGHSLRTYVLLKRVSRNGQPLPTPADLTISLTSGDESKVAVPLTVTMAAGMSGVSVPLTGVDRTTSSYVLVSATAPGHEEPQSQLGVNVVTPTLQYFNVASTRSVGAARDEFNATWKVGSEIQQAASTQSIQLEIVSATPGIVDGFYSSATGGTPQSEFTVEENDIGFSGAYVGSPVAVGTYRIRATLPTVGSWDSLDITVAAPGSILGYTGASESLRVGDVPPGGLGVPLDVDDDQTTLVLPSASRLERPANTAHNAARHLPQGSSSDEVTP